MKEELTFLNRAVKIHCIVMLSDLLLYMRLSTLIAVGAFSFTCSAAFCVQRVK
jgi:hypothetical protein